MSGALFPRWLTQSLVCILIVPAQWNVYFLQRIDAMRAGCSVQSGVQQSPAQVMPLQRMPWGPTLEQKDADSGPPQALGITWVSRMQYGREENPWSATLQGNICRFWEESQENNFPFLSPAFHESPDKKDWRKKGKWVGLWSQWPWKKRAGISQLRYLMGWEQPYHS